MKLVPLEVVLSFLESFDSGLIQKFGQLYSLMMKLKTSWYPSGGSMLTQRHSSEEEKGFSEIVGPSGKFNRLKFVRLVQNLVKFNRFLSTKSLAEILSSCSEEEAIELLCTEGLQPVFLYSTMKLANAEMSQERLKGNCSEDSSPEKVDRLHFGKHLWRAARFALMGRLKKILLEYFPENMQVEIGDLDYKFSLEISESGVFDTLSLCKCVPLLIEAEIGHEDSFLSEKDLQILSKFSLFVLLVILNNGTSIGYGLCIQCVSCVKSILCNSEVWDWLRRNANGLKLQQNLLGVLYWVLVNYFGAKWLESLFFSVVDPVPFIVPVSADDALSFARSWKMILALLGWLDIGFPDLSPKFWPASTRNVIRSAILYFVAVARLPAFCSFTRVPPSAFRYGWTPEAKWERAESGASILILPTTPVFHLQNVDVLREFVWRVCWTESLGWSGRQEFEEVWMALLGVLSATPIGQELQSNSPQKLGWTKSELRRIRRQLGKKCVDQCETISDGEDQLFNANPERTYNSGQFSFGQFSLETLWSLTGILAAERSLVGVGQQQNSVAGEEKETAAENVVTELDVERLDKGLSEGEYEDVAERRPVVRAGESVSREEEKEEKWSSGVKKSASSYVMTANNNLDLVSCLHFLLDLFSHWLRDGPDSVPLPLLSATVESLVLLSDLFTERGQYEWLKRQLKLVHSSRASDDELLQQDLILGLLKSAAVLGVEDSEGQKEVVGMIEVGLASPQLSVRLYTLHGLLFLVQSLTSDESWGLIHQVTDFLCVELDAGLAITDFTAVLSRPQSMDYQLVLWSLGMYIAESYHDSYSRQNFLARFIEQSQRALTTSTVAVPVTEGVLSGLESLLATAGVDGKKQLSKFATTSLQRPLSSHHTVFYLELLLTCLYCGLGMEGRCYGDATPESEIPPAMPESQLSAMEQLTFLFSRISGGTTLEAAAVGKALPGFLADNFSPGDVMNRVISELLAPTQAHPKILLRVIRCLFESLRELEQSLVVSDWALLSVPTFAHKTPVTSATSSLSCFLVSASANPWIRRLFPILLDRIGKSDEVDKELFRFVISGFRHQLEQECQVQSLILSMKDAGKRHPVEMQLVAGTPEAIFAQKLASGDPKTRKKALNKLRTWIGRRMKSKTYFTLEDMLKLWKGLYFCMWMQDKPLLQEELSESVSGLVSCFSNTEQKLMYLKTFLDTVAREWYGIDRWRMDKFLMFDYESIASDLFDAAKCSYVTGDRRKKLYEYIKKFRIASQGLDPFEENVSDVGSDIDEQEIDKAARRYIRRKLVGSKEKKKQRKMARKRPLASPDVSGDDDSNEEEESLASSKGNTKQKNKKRFKKIRKK